jgi:hypothetical protein
MLDSTHSIQQAQQPTSTAAASLSSSAASAAMGTGGKPSTGTISGMLADFSKALG